MHISAHLDLDLIALDEANQVTCLLELTAPTDERVAQRPGRTLMVVLDCSGSMRGEPIEAARTSIESLVRRLGQQDSFGLVTFNDEAHVVIPLRAMADHNLDSLIDAVRNVYPGGSTNLSGGYLVALRETKASLARSAHTGATVLLLSDGHANAGETDPQRMHDIARSAVSDSIVPSTVGLGLGYDEVLLDFITRGGNGNHRFADSVDVATAEIAQTVSDLLDVSALAATLRITPSDSAVNRITVRNDVPNWADERSVVVALEFGNARTKFTHGWKFWTVERIGSPIRLSV
jgi:Ca-activated chloride channel family protein